MTPEELEDLVRRGDAMAVAEALGPLSENERKKLSTTAATLLKECDRYQRQQWSQSDRNTRISAVMRRLLSAGHRGTFDEIHRAAKIAALGVCPISVTTRIVIRKFEDMVKVLSDRRPAWLNEWLDERFKDEWPQLDWEDFWSLYKSGACSKPTSDDYYRFMAVQLGGWGALQRRSGRRLSETLAAEPDLVEDVWKLFEVETVAFTFHSPLNTPTKYETWIDALCRLAQRGGIDRQRLLDSSLSGLTQGFKQNVLSGLVRFHNELKPTADEIVERQATYLDLLNVTTSQVGSFALAMLKKIEQAKRLDDGRFVAAATAVFDMPTKAPAKSTLGLFKKIGKRSPELRPRIAEVLVDSALLHPVDDIVTAALELLAAWRDELSDDTLRRLAEVELSAPAQSLVRELLADRPRLTNEPSAAVSSAPEQSADTMAEVDALDARWRRLAGVDEVVAAIEEQRWPGPLSFRIHEVSILTGVEPLAPIESIDELRDVIAHAVEIVDSPLDFERIIDGISRLGRDESEEFDRLATPLIKRLHDRPHDESGRALVIGTKTPLGFVRLLQWWLGDRPAAGRTKVPWFHENWAQEFYPTPMHRFLDRRCQQLRRRLQWGQRGPLLSMPTHQSGWIDPRVLVQRWRESLDQDVPILKTDAVLAMLRLAPDHRSAARKAGAQITHPWISMLRWALGEPCALPKTGDEQSDLWIAAANARGDDESFAMLRDAGLDGAGPDGSARANYVWRPYMRDWSSILSIPDIELNVQPQLPQIDLDVDRPSVFSHVKSEQRYWREAQWMTRLLATISPAIVSARIAMGIEDIMGRLDEKGSAWEGNHPHLRLLFDADRPIDDLACLLLLVGLCSKDEDVRGLAIDAAVEGVQDGRLHPATLGPTLARLAVPGWLKLNRLCVNLEEVARVSSMHAWVVCESLPPLLAAYDELPRDAHHLLALLQKVLMQLGGELPAEAKQRLAAFQGGGKTGKLAEALVKLTASDEPAAADARHLLLQARLERAQRWQSAKQERGDPTATDQVLQRS